MAWPAVKKEFTQEAFRAYVGGLLWVSWRPSKIVWHNTAAPSLAQWIKSADADRSAGLVPGSTRIGNLEKFFRFDNKWSGCPHLFIANDFIWVMNPLALPGVHSPSFNATAIGIEMVGDFAIEDDDSGEGLKVKRSTVFATAVLCSALGLDPAQAIKLHKEDPRTTHDCPGIKIARDKGAMVEAVADLMAGGDHNPGEESAPEVRRGTTTVDALNLRTGPAVTSDVVAALDKGTVLEILGEARNSSTEWLRVKTAQNQTGWVAGRYVHVA